MKSVSPVSTAKGHLTFQVSYKYRDAFDGVAWRFEKREAAVTEGKMAAVTYWNVRELRSGLRAKIDGRARAGRQLPMARHEVGVQVSLDDVLDCETVLLGCLEVDFYVALRIYYGRYPLRS